MKKVGIWCVVAVVVVLWAEAGVAGAVNCSPLQLAPCVGAITGSQPPSSACCNKLKEQKPCLCGYLKDPNLREYVNSPGAKKVAAACGVPSPTC
ncbi:Non-specific lipid-transfer protein 2 [Sesamum angolense]|uniref:Non-specific lipid-transfer protein 2 n=1 Tax=Sesamum angolense TaxID=2727404 RepID=A0AAE1WHN6_9LAMI|nr:Non-specific lipid-transfer protein 2 [Sesamum angolense]